MRRTFPLRLCSAMVLISSILGSPLASAVDIAVARSAFRLHFDSDLWQEVADQPSAELVLRCVAKHCSDDARVVVINDPRPVLPASGSAFGPGTIGAAAMNVRFQSLAPNRRLIATRHLMPTRVAGRRAYLGSFKVENRDLERSDLIAVIVPFRSEALSIALSAKSLKDNDERLFLNLLKDLSFADPHL